jgi:2-C-methyl-D-erythritol 2,4-cyclodiphosphate synthase
MEFRIGQGIDVHPFQEGRRCVLGGVEIPHARGLHGHSDADVIAHALMDAILGAIGERDIGTLFPDSDSTYKDADSCLLLSGVWRVANEKGWKLVNADITVLAEAPRLKPFVDRMRERLSLSVNASPEQVTIKATTTERLGFIGREEGIVASAVVLLSRG